MMTTVESINLGLDPHQMGQPTQAKVDEKPPAAEPVEQDRVDIVSTPSIGRSALSKMQIEQAADIGLLRPVWMEVSEMDHEMPRMVDIINKTWQIRKDHETQRTTDETQRAAAKSDKPSSPAANGASESAAKAGIAANGASEHAVKFEPAVGGGAEHAAKAEPASDGAEYSGKSEFAAADGVTSSNK